MKLLFLALLVLGASSLQNYNHYAQNIIDEVNSDPSSTWKAGHNKNWENFPVLDVKKLMGAK